MDTYPLPFIIEYMRREQQPVIIQRVTDYYLQARDFNGLPISTLRADYSLTKRDLKLLIETGDIEIHFGYGHPNPHVRALSLGNLSAQLKTLAHISNEQLDYTVLYPTVRRLKKVVNPTAYQARPYSLMLALGMPQLEPQYFDPQILKTYRDDPRYSYDYSGVAGRLCITTEGDEDDNMPESDKVLMDTFGAGFSREYVTDGKTCVVALPYYLHKLTPEHQMLWKHRQLDGTKYLPEKGFVQSQIYGSWDFDTTMYEAFVAELKIINEMAVAIEGQPLFKKDYADGSSPPRNFHRLLMPTKREYQEFAESLDKLMGDNLNRKFFKNRMAGSVADTDKGTITLLKEYFNRFFNASDMSPVEDMLKTFRKVRKERSKSSHHDLQDEFQYQYNHKQRDIMRKAYTAIRLIRLALTSAPAAKDIKVPNWLYEGDISHD